MARESSQAKLTRVEKIIAGLKRTYPQAHCELSYSNPLELLVATMLSAQCTDKQVNLVTPTLFKKYSTAADYAKQLELSLKLRDKLSETHNAIIQIRDVKKQVDDLVKRVGPQSKPITDAGTALNKRLTEVEEALYQTKNQSSQDPLNFPIRLNNKLAALLGVVSRSETPPNDQSYVVYDELNAEINAQLQKLSQIIKTDVPAFNQLVRDANIPAIVVKPPTPM